MDLFFIVVVLLRLSLATAVNFTQVFEWPDGMDYEWPSEASRTSALNNRTYFNPKLIQPIFMAVYETRIFLSLEKYNVGIPVTLVSLPTSSETSAPPELTPFPSWDMHNKDEYGDCNKIEEAAGLEVDAVGRLWVLDSGSENCNAKLWISDLFNNDKTKLIHRFSFGKYLADLVLDETPNGTFAYIARLYRNHIVVFSLERNQSWIVDTPGFMAYSIALSPKEEPRQLYLSHSFTNEFFSISVAALRNGIQTANPKLIGKWTRTQKYRMLMDNHGTMYIASFDENFITSWNTYQSMQEQRFLVVEGLNTVRPFTFALDSSGTFWVTEINETATKPTFRLLKAAVGAKPYYISDCQTTVPSTTTVTHINCTCEEGVRFKEANKLTEESTNFALIGLIICFIFSIVVCTYNLWLNMRLRKLQNYIRQRDAGAVEMPTVPKFFQPEMLDVEQGNRK
ncbi:protein yellow-like [Cloeon dipterum]|uniref:protein yellow-like n=1 Tax=Cloeon dipterum TaxID=197152 RepID=UPI00321F7920